MNTSMRGAFRSSLCIASVVSLVAVTSTGCGLLKKKASFDDAGATAAADEAGAATDEAGAAAAVDAAAAPAVPAPATNVADVARFPDEVALSNVPAIIARPTNVRDIPSVGKISATLAKGASVTELASRGTGFLVTFVNPANSAQLMGWIPAEAFTPPPAVDAGVKQVQCNAPDVAVHTDVDQCARLCHVDTDCPGGQACRGAAIKIVGSKLTDPTNICVVFTPPVTAANALPDMQPSGAGGHCPLGMSLGPRDLQCHRNCAVGAVGACRPGFKCTKCPTVTSAVCAIAITAGSFCR